MKKAIAIFLFFILFGTNLKAQDPSNNLVPSRNILSFEPGLLMGNPTMEYPVPFSTHISFNISELNGRFFWGLGSGAEIIGKTFVPLFADLRVIPFRDKPVFLYGKAGYSFCFQSSEESKWNSYSSFPTYLSRPHISSNNIETKGGLLIESGIGILLKRNDYRIAVGIGFRHQQTSDVLTLQNGQNKTYENYFNRIAFRYGFWF
jgi:hypothetical protein